MLHEVPYTGVFTELADQRKSCTPGARCAKHRMSNLGQAKKSLTHIRGGFRGGRGPPPLSSGSGIFWDNVLEWYMNLYKPKDSRRRNAHKNISFA